MERLVITGYGVKCPNGYNNNHFRESLEHGNFEQSYYDSTAGKRIVVGRIPDEELGEFYNTKYSRVTKIVLSAAKEAIEIAKVPTDGSLRVAVVVGSASGPAEETESTFKSCWEHDLRKYPLLGIGLMSYHSMASAIIGEFGLDAKALTLITGCNSGSDALYVSRLLLSNNEADICIVGASDAPICEPVLYGFTKLHSAESDVPVEEAGIPFSGKDKFIISEGAGVVVLERDSVAVGRKAERYAELLGIASNNDGLSSYHSDTSGLKMQEVVGMVLNGMEPSYINSQAMGLKQNDSIELAVRESLLPQVPITSIKGVTGHPFGSAGIMQVISSILSIEHGFIPRTKSNSYTRTLDIVTENVCQPVDSVCITTHGFGGNNSCILLRKVSEPGHQRDACAAAD